MFGLKGESKDNILEGERESENENNYADDSDCGSIDSESGAGSDVYVYEDPYCHVLDPEDDSFLNDVDVYGLAYARYKARVMREAKLEEDVLDDEDESYNSENSG